MNTARAFDIVLALAAKAEQRVVAQGNPAAIRQVNDAMHLVTTFARGYFVDQIKATPRD